MILPVAGLASWHGTDGDSALVSVVTLVVTTAVLPMLFVYAAYLAGLISSPDLPRRSERLQPALFTTLCAVAAYPLLREVGASPLFLSLDTALALQMALLAVVTIWWKISYHAAGAAGLAGARGATGRVATTFGSETGVSGLSRAQPVVSSNSRATTIDRAVPIIAARARRS